jgi:hypothetical protein
MRQAKKRPGLSGLQRRALLRAIRSAIRAAETYKAIAEDAVAALERVVLATETDAERGAPVN